MKVADINQKANDIYTQNAVASQQMFAQNSAQAQQDNRASEQSVSSSDRVEISSGSRLLQRANRASEVIDPQRAAKMQQLQARVQSGTYQVSPERVAGAMINDLIKEIG